MHRAGKPVDFEELPTPPGFGPIPVNAAPGAAAGPVPAARSPPAPAARAAAPAASPPAAAQQPAVQARPAPAAPGRGACEYLCSFAHSTKMYSRDSIYIN